jgi:hypothetical protein
MFPWGVGEVVVGFSKPRRDDVMARITALYHRDGEK